ncbi:MAG: dephospho-CoA kinase [Spirochaetaceae bacterium]|jgi:dephospho-CoA kinase|nr:dephospho-CoA kinase [Spirochaetaceae bacterium]
MQTGEPAEKPQNAREAAVPPPFLIGLTGLYCAGKNHVAARLERRGLPVLDVDTLGHRALELKQEEIVRRFGNRILGPDRRIDRARLGKQVFRSAADLAALEAIVHPAANALTETWIAGQSGPCVINAALIHRSTVFSRLDLLLVVRAPLPVRLFRAWKRDALPLGELLRRFHSQKNFPRKGSQNPQFFPSQSDIQIIENSGFPGSNRNLEKRINHILEGLDSYGKEKITARGGFGGSIPGDCGKRRDPYF